MHHVRYDAMDGGNETEILNMCIMSLLKAVPETAAWWSSADERGKDDVLKRIREQIAQNFCWFSPQIRICVRFYRQLAITIACGAKIDEFPSEECFVPEFDGCLRGQGSQINLAIQLQLHKYRIYETLTKYKRNKLNNKWKNYYNSNRAIQGRSFTQARSLA